MYDQPCQCYYALELPAGIIIRDRSVGANVPNGARIPRLSDALLCSAPIIEHERAKMLLAQIDLFECTYASHYALDTARNSRHEQLASDYWHSYMQAAL